MKRLSLAKRRMLAHDLNTKLEELFPHAKCALNYRTSWELLVAVQLSAQCTDRQVNKVTPALFSHFKTLDDYIDRPQVELEKYIFSTGFYRNKAKNIRGAAMKVRDEFGGEVPRSMEEILMLPGVARKTANVVLGNAYGVVEGIAIDTHMIRLTRLHRLTHEKTPEKIEKDIMKLLPRSEWLAFTYRMIEYGRTYCTARKHNHEMCPLTPIVDKYA